jgi:hypothetical protein
MFNRATNAGKQKGFKKNANSDQIKNLTSACKQQLVRFLHLRFILLHAS